MSVRVELQICMNYKLIGRIIFLKKVINIWMEAILIYISNSIQEKSPKCTFSSCVTIQFGTVSSMYLIHRSKKKFKDITKLHNIFTYILNLILILTYGHHFQTRTVQSTIKVGGLKFLRLDQCQIKVEPWWRHNYFKI